MDISGHADRGDSSILQSAAESAQAVADAEEFIPQPLTFRRVLAMTIIVAFALFYAASQYYGVSSDLVLTQRIATENSLTYYSTVAGIGGFVGSIIASNRLAAVERDTVSVGQMAAPVAVTFMGNVVAGFLFPAN